MKYLASALVAAVSADNINFEYMRYIAEQGKSYNSIEEFNARMMLFSYRDQIINEWNADETNTSRMGHNFLSDWTPEEQKALRGLTLPGIEHKPTFFGNEAESNQTLTTFNWCTTANGKGVDKCTPIKNQGSCGSCWAFSATETVESALAIYGNSTPVALSPQQLVSCSSAYGNSGCGGGWYYWAWNYMMTNAQETEASYPYKSGNFGITGTCTANLALGVAKTASPTDYVVVG